MKPLPIATEGASMEERVLAFNLLPASYAHRSWMPLRWRAEPLHGRRTHEAVSNWLLQRHGLHALNDWSMHEPEKRLFLLDPPELARLALELGIALQRSSLSRLIDGKAVRALLRRPGIDLEALQFGLASAPVQLDQAMPRLDLEPAAGGRAVLRLHHHGMGALLSLLDPAWFAVLGRARLHTTRWHAQRGVLPLPGLQRSATKDFVFEQLLPQRFASWAWLF